MLVFHSLEEEFPERIDRWLARKAIINGLVIFVRFEPEFIGVREEDQTENEEEDDEAKRRLGH